MLARLLLSPRVCLIGDARPEALCASPLRRLFFALFRMSLTVPGGAVAGFDQIPASGYLPEPQ